MKVTRVLLLVCQAALEVRRLIHPHAFQPHRFGRRVVCERLTQSIWAF